MLKTICYISDLNTDESFGNLKSIYKASKENNRKNNISGILIYRDKNFLQVFEGEPNIVDKTFEKISLDPRHKNVFTLIDQNTEYRFFEDYKFGFTVVKDKATLDSLRDYIDWLKNAENIVANEIVYILEKFINTY